MKTSDQQKTMSLPVVAVVVSSWVWVVGCELPNQDHIQLFCFWAVAWLFEYTVEATRLIMKIVFSEIHMSPIKPVVSVPIEYLYYYKMKIFKSEVEATFIFPGSYYLSESQDSIKKAD